MRVIQPLTILLWAAISTAALAGEPAAVPAYPATPENGCIAGCPDTLHASHALTFTSRAVFPVGTAKLTQDARRELDRLLAELESYAVVEHVEVIGHADPSGPRPFNRWISELRAKRVRDHLAGRGVDPRRLSWRGVGESEPLPGAADSAAQRRIEVRVTLRPFL